MIQTSSASGFQILAWVAAGAGAAIAGIQLLFNSVRERRTQRQNQARFGYELLDALFDDPAGEVLRKIDRGTWADPASDDGRFLAAFRRAFESGRPTQEPAVIDARLEFDRVLYYFDRVQHAIDGKLTRFDDVKAPLAWYGKLLAPYHSGIAAYAEGVYYGRAVHLLAELRKLTSKPDIPSH